MVDTRGVRDVFSKDHCKTEVQMPINVAMQEPGPGVVRDEANGDFIASIAGVDNVTHDWVIVAI